MSKTVWITTGVVAAAIGLTTFVASAERGNEENRGFRGHHGGYEHGRGERRGRRGGRRHNMTKEDFDARTRAKFAKWDTNSDGVVDVSEAEARVASRIERRFQRRGNRRLQRMLRRFDTDNDGKITRDEFQSRVTERFERMDLTGDGQITDADLPPMLRDRNFLSGEGQMGRGHWRGHRGHRGPRRGRRMLRQLAGADTNKDGAVTLQEFQDRAAQRMARWDRNKDGVLDETDRSALLKETVDYRVKRFMHRFGAGKDGQLTREQFAAHRNERFARRDTDGDGVIERSERHRGHHGKRRWRRHHDGHPGGRHGRGHRDRH